MSFNDFDTSSIDFKNMDKSDWIKNFKDYVIDLIPIEHRTIDEIAWFHTLPIVQYYIAGVEMGMYKPIEPTEKEKVL